MNPKKTVTPVLPGLETPKLKRAVTILLTSEEFQHVHTIKTRDYDNLVTIAPLVHQLFTEGLKLHTQPTP